jgi:hypothetical protein
MKKRVGLAEFVWFVAFMANLGIVYLATKGLEYGIPVAMIGVVVLSWLNPFRRGRRVK